MRNRVLIMLVVDAISIFINYIHHFLVFETVCLLYWPIVFIHTHIPTHIYIHVNAYAY